MNKVIIGLTIFDIDKGYNWLLNLKFIPYKLVVFFNTSSNVEKFYTLAGNKGINLVSISLNNAYQNALKGLYGELVTDENFCSNNTDYYAAKNILQKHLYDEWEYDSKTYIIDSEDEKLDFNILDKTFNNSSDITLIDSIKNKFKFRNKIVVFLTKDALLIPNIKIELNFPKILRNTHDYIWPMIAETKNFKVKNINIFQLSNYYDEFSVSHDFFSYFFSYMIQSKNMDISKEKFISLLKNKKIMNKILISFKLPTCQMKEVIKKINSFNNEEIFFAFSRMRETLNRFHTKKEIFKISRQLEKKFSLKSLRLLGIGSESIVYTDEKKVYKYFISKKVDLSNLIRFSLRFKKCQHFYVIKIKKYHGHKIIIYKYEQSTHYKGGMANQLIDFLIFQYNNGFVFKNIKKENFIIVKGVIKLIDYGQSFSEYSEELFNIACLRAYQMLKYVNLTEFELRRFTIYTMKFGFDLLQIGYKNFKFLLDDKISPTKNALLSENEVIWPINMLDQYLMSSKSIGLESLSLNVTDYWYNGDKNNAYLIMQILHKNSFEIINALPNIMIDSDKAIPVSKSVKINISAQSKIHKRKKDEFNNFLILVFMKKVSNSYTIRLVNSLLHMKNRFLIFYPFEEDYMSFLLKYHPVLCASSLNESQYIDFDNQPLIFLSEGYYPIDENSLEQVILNLQLAEKDALLFKAINLHQPICQNEEKFKYVLICKNNKVCNDYIMNTSFNKLIKSLTKIDKEYFYFEE